jgi:hypothetical protein
MKEEKVKEKEKKKETSLASPWPVGIIIKERLRPDTSDFHLPRPKRF